MSDVTVIKGLIRTVITPRTEKGETWIRREMVNKRGKVGGEISIVINKEFTEDVIEEMQKGGLDVHEVG